MANYNPYDAAKRITEEKSKWANAKAKGEDASVFEQSAAAYYKELRDNGRDDIADFLQKSDSVQASEYLKKLTPSYTADAASLQHKSNDVYKTASGYLADIGKSYDDIYKNSIGIDPTRTGYGKDILSGYGIAADEAYKTTLGGTSAENGGNVDSYAAANANRQKSAVLSQGYGDVLDYYNSIAGNANIWADSKANSIGGYLTQLQGNVDADRDVVKRAYDGTIDLWKTQDSNRTEKEIAQSENEVSRYLGELDAGTASYISNLEAQLEREKLAQEKMIEDSSNTAYAPTASTNYAQGSSDYDAIKTEITRNGNNTRAWLDALSKYGLDDVTAINLAADLEIDIGDYVE